MDRAIEAFDASRENPIGNFILIMIALGLVAFFIWRARTERARQCQRMVKRAEREYEYGLAIQRIVQEGINNVRRRQRR